MLSVTKESATKHQLKQRHTFGRRPGQREHGLRRRRVSRPGAPEAVRRQRVQGGRAGRACAVSGALEPEAGPGADTRRRLEPVLVQLNDFTGEKSEDMDTVAARHGPLCAARLQAVVCARRVWRAACPGDRGAVRPGQGHTPRRDVQAGRPVQDGGRLRGPAPRAAHSA